MISDKKLADLGFGDLAFKGRPITWSPSCPDGYMYFLNTNYINFIYDPAVYFKMGQWLPIVNQPEDRVVHVMTACNLVISNARKHGVIFNISE